MKTNILLAAKRVYFQLSGLRKKEFFKHKRVARGTLYIRNIETFQYYIFCWALGHCEVPNWSKDGQIFSFNKQGQLTHIPFTSGIPNIFNTMKMY